MLSTPGIGSGLDINGIIGQLMAIEQRPLVQLGVDEVQLQAQLSAYGKLKSTVSTFRSAMQNLSEPEQFKFFSASSSDDDVLTAKAEPTAAKGTFNINVARIAENHRLAAATVFADTDTTKVGAPGDEMTINVGGNAFVVDIGDKTLDEIREAINSATGNTGVTASTLQDDSGYHLTLSGDETGSSNFVTVSYSGVDPFSLQDLNTDRDSSGTFTSADLDAVMTIENTFTVTRSSNTVSDVLAGVTMTLESAGSTTLSVTRDTAKIQGSVNQFIGVYNEVMKTMAQMRGDVLATERASLLNLEAQFRGILNTAAETNSVFDFLFEIGVSTKLDGTLELNGTVFQSALENDPDGLPDLFANATGGLATRMEALAGSLLEAGGLLDSREQSINSQLDDIETRRANLEFRLQQKEATLIDQFTALDTLVARLNTTSSFLTTQLAQLANLSSGGGGNNNN